MSGFMRKAALVVGAVALVAATAGAAAPLLAPGIGGVASIAGVSAATLTAIGTYGGLAAGVLTAISTATAPGMSSQGSQTSFTTNPQSGLPYAMGRTRMSGLRIYANTNTRPGYTKFNDLLWFGALLSIGGAIGGIEKFTADNEIVTFDSSGNAIGDYHDYQGQKIHLGGQQTSALALSLVGGSAPGWTTAHKLSGITHAMWCLRYNKQGEMYGAGAPEPAWIGNWVKVYDPRLDSTYPGGSGSCRALVESTYVWSDNPGLHALTWALGRWQNGKRTCGIGAPVANIRVAEFVECANVCEANGWKVGGVEWTTDSKWDTLKRILQAGGAIPTQTGAMVGCLVSTPRTAIATIESRHLLDSLSIAATKSRRDRFNSVIPRYVDEDSDWSVISGTAITVSDYVTADKGQRTKEIDYPLVQVFSGQVAKQPGQLAAYDIVNSREAGPINFTTGPEWIGLKTGDVILLNVPEEGLVNQPVLITRRAPDPSTGKVAFSAQTETYAKHAYALGQSTTPPAPFSLTAPDLKPPAPAAVNWAAAGTVTGEGLPAIVVTGNSEMPSADAVLIDYKLPADATWTRSAILSANEPVQHIIAPLQSETAYQIRVGYRVEQIDGEFTILAAVTTGAGIISDISDTIGEQRDELDELQLATAAAAAASAAAQSQIAAIEGSISADFSAVNAEVDALQSSLSTAQGNITSLQSSVNASLSALNSDVDALETQAAGIISSVTGLGDEITALGDDVATLESTVSAHGSSIGQNAIAIAGLSGNLATLTTRVNAGGNTNLIPGLESGFAGWSAPSFDLIVSGGWGLVASRMTDSDQLIFLDSPPAPVFATLTYTAAADSVLQIAGGTGSARVEILFKDSAGEIIGNPQSGSRSANHDFTNNGSSRAILTATGIAPANSVTATVRLTAQKNSGTLTVVGWRQVKLEQGSVATSYSFDASVYQQFQAISTLDVGFASLTTTVGAQGSIITQNSQAISGLQGSLSSLSSDVSVHGANISSLQQASTSQAGQLAQHTTDIATANSNISINAQAINTANGSLASLTTRVGTAESSITSLQSASTTQAGQISTLQSTVATQGSSISSNATAITTLQGNVASLTTRVNAAQTNLLPNGGLENGFAGAISDGGFTYGNWGTWGPNAWTSANGQHVFQFGDITQVQVGATYWISCDPLALGGSDICCDLLFLDASGNVLLDGGQNVQNGPFNYSTDDTRRGLIAVSAVAPSGTMRIRARIIGNVVSGATIGFRRVKVEMGSNWTGFSSEASIVQSFTAYSGLDSSLATLSSTVSTQGGSITSLQSSFTSLNGTVSSLSSTVSAQGTSISTLQSASSTQAGQIASLSTRVNASQANLLRNGGLENGFSGATSTAGFGWFSSPSWGPAASTTTNGTQVFQFADIEAVQVGAIYWISCDPLAYGTSSIYCDLLFLNAAGSVILDGPQNSQNGEFNFSGDNTRRGLIAVSAVAPTGTVKIRPRIVANVVGGQVAGFRRVKVETGTSWTPFSSEASIVQSFEAISTLNSSYASLSSTVSTQGATISSQATAISTLQGQQSSLSSTVSAQGASITSLQTTTATLQGNVATLTTRVSASGANILPNGGLENGFNSGISSAGGFQFSASNDWGPIALSYDNGLRIFIFAPVYNPQVGGAYTFSVDPLQFGTSDVYCDIICQDVNGNVLLDGVEHGISGQFNFDNTDTRRGQMACTVSSVPSGTDRLICRVFGSVRDGQPIGFRRAKLENGTVWSRYSAEATAAQQFQTLSTLTTQYASLSSTVSTQGVTISTQATAISTLQSNVTSLFAKWSLELDVNGYVSGMVTNNNGTRADLTLRMDKVKMVTPSGLGGYWQVTFDSQGRPTQSCGDDSSGVTIEIGYLA